LTCLIRLAVRTPRCGRGNPGSNPGLDISFRKKTLVVVSIFTFAFIPRDSLAERSKAPDSSSGGAIRVGSNPTAVSLFFSKLCSAAESNFVGKKEEVGRKYGNDGFRAKEVPGGFEPPSVDSESTVLTVTPRDQSD
jgi:hypothetical protein